MLGRWPCPLPFSALPPLPPEATSWRCLFPIRSTHCGVPQGQGLSSLFLEGSDFSDQRK